GSGRLRGGVRASARGRSVVRGAGEDLLLEAEVLGNGFDDEEGLIEQGGSPGDLDGAAHVDALGLRFLDRGVDASAGGEHGVIGACEDEEAGTGGGEGGSDAHPHPCAAVDGDELRHPRGSGGIGGGLAHDLSPFVSGPVVSSAGAVPTSAGPAASSSACAAASAAFFAFFASRLDRNASMRANFSCDSNSTAWATLSMSGWASRGAWKADLLSRTARGAKLAIRSA